MNYGSLFCQSLLLGLAVGASLNGTSTPIFTNSTTSVSSTSLSSSSSTSSSSSVLSSSDTISSSANSSSNEPTSLSLTSSSTGSHPSSSTSSPHSTASSAFSVSANFTLPPPTSLIANATSLSPNSTTDVDITIHVTSHVTTFVTIPSGTGSLLTGTGTGGTPLPTNGSLASARACNSDKWSWLYDLGLTFVSNSTFTTSTESVSYTIVRSAWYITSPEDAEVFTLCDKWPRVNATKYVTTLDTTPARTSWSTFITETPVSHNVSAPDCTIPPRYCSVLEAEYTSAKKAYEDAWDSYSADPSAFAAPTVQTLPPPQCSLITKRPAPMTTLVPPACVFNSATLELLYWPVQTVGDRLCGNWTTISATPSISGRPNTAVGFNTTFTSPTVYMVFSGMYSVEEDWGVGETLQGILPLQPTAVSSICAIPGGGFGSPEPVNYADFNLPVPASPYRCQPHCNTNPWWPQYWTSSGSFNPTPSENLCSTIYDDYAPALAVPTEFSLYFTKVGVEQDGLKCSVSLNSNGVFYDPPIALVSQTAAAMPTITGGAGAGVTTSATPSPTKGSAEAPHTGGISPSGGRGPQPTDGGGDGSDPQQSGDGGSNGGGGSQPTNGSGDGDGSGSDPQQSDGAEQTSPGGSVPSPTTGSGSGQPEQTGGGGGSSGSDDPGSGSQQTGGPSGDNGGSDPGTSPTQGTGGSGSDDPQNPSNPDGGAATPTTSSQDIGGIIASIIGISRTTPAPANVPTNIVGPGVSDPSNSPDSSDPSSSSNPSNPSDPSNPADSPDSSGPSDPSNPSDPSEPSSSSGSNGDSQQSANGQDPATGSPNNDGGQITVGHPGAGPGSNPDQPNSQGAVLTGANGQSITAVVSGDSVVLPQTTLAAGQQTNVAGLGQVSVGPNGIVQQGQTRSFADLDPSQSAGDGQTAFTVNGKTLTINSATNIVLESGQTLTPGSQGIVVSGTTFSLAPSASNLVVNGVAQAPAGQAPRGPALLTVGDKVFTANSNSAFVLGAGTTLTPGGQVTAAGTTLSLASGGSNAIINGVTQALATPQASSLPALTIEGQTVTANSNSAFVLGPGTTLTPGGQVTAGGKTFSLAPGGDTFLVNGVTQTHSASYGTGLPILTIDGQTFTANSDSAYVLDSGATLTAGGEVTVSGTTYSLPPSATVVVIDGQTSTIPDFAGVASAAVITVDGRTYTESADGSFVFGPGTTLTPGGVVTIDGITISLPGSATATDDADDVVVINGQTSTLSEVGFSPTAGGGAHGTGPTATGTQTAAATSLTVTGVRKLAISCIVIGVLVLRS